MDGIRVRDQAGSGVKVTGLAGKTSGPRSGSGIKIAVAVKVTVNGQDQGHGRGQGPVTIRMRVRGTGQEKKVTAIPKARMKG